MNSSAGDILLVGSVPFDTVDDVMNTCAQSLGERLFAMPDGEVGERSTWIMSLPHLVYSKNKDLEPVLVVPPEMVKSPDSHDPVKMKATRGTFRVKPGVTETTFDLPYAREAIRSYEIFRKLRDDGKIASHVRFQVSIPCTHDATSGFFPEPNDRLIVTRAFEKGIQADIKKILEHVPENDLVIQWDYCSELLDILGARDKYVDGTPKASSNEEKFQLYTSKKYLAPMTEMIPDDVLVGYHLCYGTWGGWPIGEVKDIGFCVRLANTMVANTPRRIDFVHLPVMPGADEAFFKPLQDLRIGNARVFLGLELADGVEAMTKRIQAARKYLPHFGVAHYCGYGRQDPVQVRELLKDLRAGAERTDH
ncbi:hypothetical protein [Pseudorhodoplanes sp.]|uniref:hypothetical protein n=1 Tax=Pseudorhodoplanes sp. TaxID=1934341 RepID=UPI003D0F151E